MNFPSLFIEGFVGCAIRAALLVAGVAAVLRLLRVRDAAVKHRVWSGVLLAMLVLPAWTAWGPKAPIRVLPQLPISPITEFDEPPSDSLPIAPAIPGADSRSPWSRPLPFMPLRDQILVCAYLAGFLALGMRLAMGTRAANRLARRAALRDERYSSAACAAPVTVGWFRPVVILPQSWRAWTPEQLGAILAHEEEHVRRRDPLVQWLALLNRAVWWFHPAAWWLERELGSLAEEACDAAVLARGHDPREYSECLLAMARSVMQSGARVNVVGMAMPGGHLPARIRQIVAGPAPRIPPARAALLATACAVICAAFAAGSLARQTAANQPSATPGAQSLAAMEAAGVKMSFDVASVKPNKSDEPPHTNVPLSPGGEGGEVSSPTGGFFSATNNSVLTYMMFAYDFGGAEISKLLPQMPRWANNTKYDIEARAQGNPTRDQLRLMMQSLLEDRFKLALHTETKQGSVYALVLAKPGKLGPHLQQHTDDASCSTGQLAVDVHGEDSDRPSGPPSISQLPQLPCGLIVRLPASTPDLKRFGGRGVSISSLIQYTAQDRPVIDRTGLSGTFDFDCEAASPHQNPPDSSAPTLPEAMQDQLGLKLEEQTGLVTSFVLDHIEEPSPN